MFYLVWQDDNPKRPLADKVAAARAAYQERYGVPATLVLVDGESVAVAGCEVRAPHAGEPVVRPGMLFAGRAG